MITIEEIRMNIQPVPQRVKEIRGGGLPLRPDSGGPGIFPNIYFMY